MTLLQLKSLRIPFYREHLTFDQLFEMLYIHLNLNHDLFKLLTAFPICYWQFPYNKILSNNFRLRHLQVHGTGCRWYLSGVVFILSISNISTKFKQLSPKSFKTFEVWVVVQEGVFHPYRSLKESLARIKINR